MKRLPPPPSKVGDGHPLLLCMETKKRRYPDERATQSALSRWSGPFKPDRAYPCPHCGDWHFTSRTEDMRVELIDWQVAMVLPGCSPKGSTKSRKAYVAGMREAGERIIGVKVFDEGDGLIVATTIGKFSGAPVLHLWDFVSGHVPEEHRPRYVMRSDFPGVALNSKELIGIAGFITHPGRST